MARSKLHAREALEHYRNAVKEQRERKQRRHEGQFQQVQVELRQLQQTVVIKQDELTRLNRENERLLSESRHQAMALDSREDVVQRMTGEIQSLTLEAAKTDGTKESLHEQSRSQAADAIALLAVAQTGLNEMPTNENSDVGQQS